MTTPEASPSFGASKKGVTLWVEKGHNRREIAERMVEAVPSLRIISTPEQQFTGTEAIAYPSAETEEGIAEFNRLTDLHGINAIWPQESGHFDLTNINAEVHVPATPETIALADDKIAFAEWLDDEAYRPFTAEAVGVNAIAALYEQRRAAGYEVVIKPAIGVASQGFWRLAERADVSVLNQPDRRVMHPDIYFKAMEVEEEINGPQRMIMMDYLSGGEVSVDLLAWRGQPLIHAARTKLERRRERIQSEHDVIAHVYDTATKLALHGMVNVQYMKDKDGQWKMLEINPRPAGGTFYSEDTGFGIITDWARLVAHEIEPDEVTQRDGDVTIALHRAWRYDTSENA
jgi:biotin carboxylase